MKKTSIPSRLVYLILVLGLANHAPAQSSGQSTRQQEVDQMLEMMKQQGMDRQQLKQMENMLRGMADMETQQKAAEVDQKRRKFDEETAGYGTATVEVDDSRYDLKVSRCEVLSSTKGSFAIQARQGPGKEDGELAIYSDRADRQQSLSFSISSRPPVNYATQMTGLMLDGQSLTWQGLSKSNERSLPMTLSVECGQEAVFYDKATRERPDAAPNIATLYLGPETYTFDAGRCSTEHYRTGNWEVTFEATATGSFRGQPAILLLKSGQEVAGTESEGAGESHVMELLLGEITPEQRQLPTHSLEQQLSEGIEQAQQEKLVANQKKYRDLERDNMSPAEMALLIESQTAELEEINAEAAAMRFPSANSGEGMTTVDGQNVLFRGPPMRTNDAYRAPVFSDLSARPEVFVTCRK